jgi:REP element-mobilizing transposase RayT
MPRLPRIKVEDQDGWYHLWNCANGQKRAFPLQDDVVRAEFIRILKFYARIYFCGVAAFQVMGSHFHLVLRFDKPRPLSRGQRKERAFALYGRKPIRPEIIEREKARGFEQRGVFLKKLRCITDGLVFGAKAEVLTFLAKLRLKGQKWALRRKEAAKHLDGAFYTLREQRGNYVPT